MHPPLTPQQSSTNCGYEAFSSTIIFPRCLSKIIAVTCFTAGVTANEHTEIKEPRGFVWLLRPRTEYYWVLRNLNPHALVIHKGAAQHLY